VKRQSAGKPLPPSSSAKPPLPPASLLLGATLAVLAIARLVFAFAPGMAAWGLNLHRFLAPGWAWIPWALAALALAPPLATPLQRGFSALAAWIDRHPRAAAFVAAAGAALLVWMFPDRLGFVGDFAMRLGAVRRGESPEALSPQAFPLDLALHFDLPLWIAAHTGASDTDAVRVIGATGAALLAVAALALGRALEARAEVRVAAAGIAFWGGYLCLFTGESKAFAELCVAVVVFAAFAVRAATPGGVLGSGLVLAVALGLHRYALGLLPAFAVALAGRWRATKAEGARLTAADVVGVTLPLASLAWIGPRLARTVLDYDLGANFMTAEARAQGGMLAAALEPLRLLDLANLAIMLAPLALVAPLLALAARRERGRHGVLVLALVLPFAAAFLFARPPQGVVRDWDSFAVPGAAFAVGAAWAAARALSAPRATWLALPALLAVLTPALQWLVHFSDPPRGIARVEAFLNGPPLRSADERSRLWDMIGMKRMSMQDYPGAAQAFESAVAVAPSPRLLTQWGMAEAMSGRHDRALATYLRAVERDSTYVTAWIGVGVSGLNAGDLEAASRAAVMLERLAPGNGKAQEIAAAVRARTGSAPHQPQ